MIETEQSTDPRWLADTLSEQVWTARPDGSLDWVNRAVATYAGREHQRIVGEGWLDMVHPDERRSVVDRWQRALSTGDPYEVEFRLRRDDGVYRWHLGRAEAIRDANGQIIAWHGTNTDIQTWRRADSLREAWPMVPPDERANAEAETAHLIANAPSAICVLRGLKHQFIVANPKFLQLISPNRDVVGKTVAEAMPEIVSQGFIEILDNVYRTGEPYIGQDVLLRFDRFGDGVLHDMIIDFVYQPTRRDDGTIDGIFVHVVEVTEHARARQALAVRMRHAELAAEIGAVLTRDAPLDVQLRQCAGAIVQFLDASFTGIWTIGETNVDLVPQASAGPLATEPASNDSILLGVVPKGHPTFDQIVNSRTAHVTNDLRNRPDADDREWAHPEGIVAFGGYPLLVDNRLVGVLALYTREPIPDITLEVLDSVVRVIANGIQRRNAEQQVTHQRDRLEQVVAEMAEAVLIYDADGEVVIANQQAMALMGVSMAEPRMKEDLNRPRSLRRPDHSPVPPHEQPTTRALVNQEVVRGERFNLSNSTTGQETTVLVSSVPLRDPSGKVTGAVSVYQDITRLRELEEEKDAFLGAAAHDLKSPLSSIHIFAQMLRRQLDRPQGPDSTRLGHYATQIERSANNMARMIDELLDLTRLQMGKRLELDRRATDLLVVLRRSAEGLGEPNQIRIESTETTVVGQWDVVRLGRLASNLIENAVKYSLDNTPVYVRVSREDDATSTWAVLTVTDQGVGIPQDDLPLVFERFHRGSNVVHTINGTGIGLASARQVVEQHGGTIDLTSALGVGTHVTVRLPTTPNE